MFLGHHLHIKDMWHDAAAGGTHDTMAGGGICGNISATGGGEDDIPKNAMG